MPKVAFISDALLQVQWFDSSSPGRVLLLLRDSSLLTLACPPHASPHSIHCTLPLETFAPQRVHLSAVVPALSGDVAVIACRFVTS